MLVPEDPTLSEDELFKEDDGEDYVPPQHDPNTPGPSNEPPTKRRHTDDEKNEDREEQEEQQQQKNKKRKGTAKKRKSDFQT